jgi:hypothetical protein
MSLDLYKTYKGFYQRWHRNPDDDGLYEMKELSYELARNLFRNMYYKTMSAEVLAEAIEAARDLRDMELDRGGFGIYYSANLIDALISGDFRIDVPYSKILSWTEKSNYYGNLYVLVSDYRPEQCKLGVTSNIETRISKYISKHGYVVDLYYLRKDIISPYMHEQRIAKKYKKYRHSGNTEGGSVEWYYLEPEVLKKEIQEIQQDE